MTLYFISDLHLQEERPDLLRAFYSYLDKIQSDASSLYILGDLFESWIGDDDDSPWLIPLKSRLKAFTDQVPCYFQQGNRDFLIGSTFARETGIALLPEAYCLQAGSETYLLMHGDQLCTDDVGYQQFRAQVRQLNWQQTFLDQPLTQRRQIAAHLRQESRSAQRGKTYEIMDVNPESVIRALSDHGVSRLIHGHTHRPAIHRVGNHTAPYTRYVLGDWDQQGWQLCLSGSDPDLVHFDLQS